MKKDKCGFCVWFCLIVLVLFLLVVKSLVISIVISLTMRSSSAGLPNEEFLKKIMDNFPEFPGFYQIFIDKSIQSSICTLGMNESQ